MKKNYNELVIADGLNLILDLTKSKGCYLYDKQSKSYFFDFFTFYASLPLGMNHPKLNTTEFKNLLSRVGVNKPANSDIVTDELKKSIETFGNLAMPDYMKHVFFISGGALAVENALKAAFDWKIKKNIQRNQYKNQNPQIIHFRQAFHGRSGYTLSLTNTADPKKTINFPKFNWPRLHNPKLTFPTTDELTKQIEKEEHHVINQIKTILCQNKHDIAGLIIEPIQGEGGDNHFRPEFFKSLKLLSMENEFLLIMDEVQTGLGITGKMWAHEHYDIEPDIVAFGKKTQVCGMMSSNRINEVEKNVFNQSSRINSTFGGNLSDFVRMAKILEIITDDKLVLNANTQGHYLNQRLIELSNQFPIITNVRSKGLFAAFDVPSPIVRNEIIKQAFKNKLIILGCGNRSIRFRPMLPITKTKIDEGIMILENTIKTIIIKQ